MTDTEIRERIARAVIEGKSARSEYYSEIFLEDEQLLGDPAVEAKIEELEARIMRKLPPSYRMFLRLFNGWRMASGAIDLLTVEDMLEGASSGLIKNWELGDDYKGETEAVECLVIGLSEVSSIKFLLDPSRLDEVGEWAMIGYDGGEDWVVSSFLIWLEESVNEFRELAEDERRERSMSEEIK
jgi:hypothetical protein